MAIRTSLKFDMRSPDFGPPTRDLYAAALDMAQFADEIGVSAINAMEHHGFADSYLPTPFVLGGGFAARTKQCRITLGAVVLPLHDPVKIAEQIAVLDLMSGGRLDVIIGAGYVDAEFRMFNSSMKQRGKLLDEGIEIILRALHGDRFEAGGREIFVRPLPVQQPEDILIVGGGVEASAKRAARFGLGFGPMQRGLFGLYDAECRRLGREPGRKFGPGGVGDVHLTHDPEAAWAAIMPHLKHAVGDYARIAEESGANSPFRGLLASEEALRSCGIFTVCTPEELLEKARTVDAIGSLTFMPLMGGMPPELGWQSLKLLAEVMPELQKIAPVPERD
ncbi:MAG: LLM class flavin-dependent oxidoreductase [Sphingomonadales bacterium]|nr:LLM class flavin-dependent oxidoreductase [Sphingomonadales bacterium]